MSSVISELKLDLTLKDPVAIKIVNNIPVEQRNEIIEKYIILGDMVISHASIATRKETVEEFFSPLREDIETIQEQLRQIIPTIAKPVEKGDITEKAIFESYQRHFIGDEFEDVSGAGKFTDILAKPEDSRTQILIELKDYTNTVPSKEVDKFWRDMDFRGTKYGIFISMRTGIAKCSGCISLKTKMDKVAVFVVNSELNWSGHIFAHYVIKKLIELEALKKKEVKGEEMGKIIAKINNHIVKLQKNIDTIDEIQNIADKLKTTSNNRLTTLINLATTYKKNVNEKIEAILGEIESAKIE